MIPSRESLTSEDSFQPPKEFGTETKAKPILLERATPPIPQRIIEIVPHKPIASNAMKIED